MNKALAKLGKAGVIGALGYEIGHDLGNKAEIPIVNVKIDDMPHKEAPVVHNDEYMLLCIVILLIFVLILLVIALIMRQQMSKRNEREQAARNTIRMSTL